MLSEVMVWVLFIGFYNMKVIGDLDQNNFGGVVGGQTPDKEKIYLAETLKFTLWSLWLLLLPLLGAEYLGVLT